MQQEVKGTAERNFKSWYFPHKCNCKKTVTEEEAIYIGDSKDLGGIDWFNCPHCKTTFTKFRNKEKHE